MARTPRRLALVALLAVAASPRGGCGEHDGNGYVPCAGKACGDACTLCAPGDPSCVETAVVKACDPAGVCAAAGTFTCAPQDACAGKGCGDLCVIDPPCRSAVPPCLAPSVLGSCDARGSCVTGVPVCTGPGDACAGKACGATCNPCGDASPCPTFAPTACDRFGRCVLATPSLCFDPCAGKACGEACDLCPPGATACPAIACVTACDGAGRCTCAGGGAACP